MKPLWQTVWTPIRLLLLEQSVLGPRCLLLYLIRQYVRQLFVADDFSRRHFQMHFFLGALRVKFKCFSQPMEKLFLELNREIESTHDKRVIVVGAIEFLLFYICLEG